MASWCLNGLIFDEQTLSRPGGLQGGVNAHSASTMQDQYSFLQFPQTNLVEPRA